MTKHCLLLLALMLAATAFASTGAAAAQEPPNPPDPAIVDGSAQKALDRARAKWKKAKIRSYRYEARRVCFCATTGWHVVNVRGGVPSKRVHADVKDIATCRGWFARSSARSTARPTTSS